MKGLFPPRSSPPAPGQSPWMIAALCNREWELYEVLLTGGWVFVADD